MTQVKAETSMTKREMARRRRLRAVQARLLVASRPEDCARVSELLGGDLLMAAYQLLDHKCDVDDCCAYLEAAIVRLAKEMLDDAKLQTPVDTGALLNRMRTSR